MFEKAPYIMKAVCECDHIPNTIVHPISALLNASRCSIVWHSHLRVQPLKSKSVQHKLVTMSLLCPCPELTLHLLTVCVCFF